MGHRLFPPASHKTRRSKMLDTTSQTSIAARASPYLRDGRATSNQGHPESLSLAGTQQSDYHGSLRSGRSYGEAGGYRGGHSTTPSQRKVSSAGQTTRASEGQALMERRKGGTPGRHALLRCYSPLEKTPHKARVVGDGSAISAARARIDVTAECGRTTACDSQ